MMKCFKIFIFLWLLVAVTLFCSGFQKTEEHIIIHEYRSSDGHINNVASLYYKDNDKDIVGTLADYQCLVRVYNRDIYNIEHPRIDPGQFLKIPIRRVKK